MMAGMALQEAVAVEGVEEATKEENIQAPPLSPKTSRKATKAPAEETTSNSSPTTILT
jgi:hypothetical protein